MDIEAKQVWHCQMPPDGVKFVVIRQEWSHDYAERHIFEIRLCDE